MHTTSSTNHTSFHITGPDAEQTEVAVKHLFLLTVFLLHLSSILCYFPCSLPLLFSFVYFFFSLFLFSADFKISVFLSNNTIGYNEKCNLFLVPFLEMNTDTLIASFLYKHTVYFCSLT